jgi:hypothetical protein
MEKGHGLRFNGVRYVKVLILFTRFLIGLFLELNYMSQIVVMLYEDPTKDQLSDERFHVELHFSPGVNCCVQKNLPPGPGFRPLPIQSKNPVCIHHYILPSLSTFSHVR